MQAAMRQNDISAASAWHRLCPAFWSAPWELRQGRLCLCFMCLPARRWGEMWTGGEGNQCCCRRGDGKLVLPHGFVISPKFLSFSLHLPPEGFMAWVTSLPACWPQEGRERGQRKEREGPCMERGNSCWVPTSSWLLSSPPPEVKPCQSSAVEYWSCFLRGHLDSLSLSHILKIIRPQQRKPHGLQQDNVGLESTTRAWKSSSYE